MKTQKKKGNVYTKKSSRIETPDSYAYKYCIPVLIFLVTLFVLLLINRPALFLNDEFITVNQLHQISIEHQTLFNECKYGCYQNGTPTQYFQAKYNVLGYSLFLPLLSLPVLTFFSLFGDQFRLPIILFWSLIPVLITIIISAGYPQQSRPFGFPLMYAGAIVSILLMMINLYFYHPFPFTAIDAPSESGAVILTNTIIGALLGVVIYQISQLLWKSKRVSLVCTASILCCSSYLFWPGTGKDHILMTFTFALVTYFIISSIITKNQNHRYLGFFCIGLLAFVRPEMGLSIFIGSIIFLGVEWLWDHESSKNLYFFLKKVTICIIATLCGTIPLFINNIITTGNLFIPSFYYYFSRTAPVGSPSLNTGEIGVEIYDSITSVSSLHNGSVIFNIPSLISSYFFTTSPVPIIKSFFSIIFFPESGNMSLASVTPLFITGIAIIIGYTIWKRPSFNNDDQKFFSLLIIYTLFTFVAYVNSIPGINTSRGIVPDMRYFLPIYFLGGLIGFYPLVRWGRNILTWITNRWLILLIPILGVFLTFLIAITMPGASYHEYTIVYQSLIYAVSILFVASFFGTQINRIHPIWVGLIFIFLISLPLSWQLLMDLFYSVGKVHGYPQWMPYLEYLTEKYLVYHVLS